MAASTSASSPTVEVLDQEEEDEERTNGGGNGKGKGRRCARVVLTRRALVEACDSLLKRAMVPVEVALARAGGVRLSEVDDVVLVGGSSRLHAIRDRLSETFGGRALTHSVNPDTAIAVGAARSYAC